MIKHRVNNIIKSYVSLRTPDCFFRDGCLAICSYITTSHLSNVLTMRLVLTMTPWMLLDVAHHHTFHGLHAAGIVRKLRRLTATMAAIIAVNGIHVCLIEFSPIYGIVNDLGECTASQTRSSTGR